MKTYPEISVVIPVKNEGAKIRACIDGILSQSIPVKEIIVIDSGSTDGTVEVLQECEKVKLLEIPSSTFNHGETRNLGVRHASGEFVVLTVGDARAYDQYWIQHLLEGFDAPNVAGVCGQQVCPHERDKNPVEWFRPWSSPSKKKYEFPAGAFEHLSSHEKMMACGWDDVTAMYRRDILLQVPFRSTPYSEDAIWAKDALSAGYAIVYNYAARVYHYHTEDKDFTFRRTMTTMYMRYRHFGFIYPKENGKKNFRKELSKLKLILIAQPMSIGEKIKWIRYNKVQEVAYKEAVATFHDALARSEEELDKLHQELCGKPPIPLKQAAPL